MTGYISQIILATFNMKKHVYSILAINERITERKENEPPPKYMYYMPVDYHVCVYTCVQHSLTLPSNW